MLMFVINDLIKLIKTKLKNVQEKHWNYLSHDLCSSITYILHFFETGLIPQVQDRH